MICITAPALSLSLSLTHSLSVTVTLSLSLTRSYLSDVDAGGETMFPLEGDAGGGCVRAPSPVPACLGVGQWLWATQQNLAPMTHVVDASSISNSKLMWHSLWPKHLHKCVQQVLAAAAVQLVVFLAPNGTRLPRMPARRQVHRDGQAAHAQRMQRVVDVQVHPSTGGWAVG